MAPARGSHARRALPHASLHAAEGMWIEWRRMERSGLRRAQEARLPLYERTRQFRPYSCWMVPGLIQALDSPGSAYGHVTTTETGRRDDFPQHRHPTFAGHATGERERALREQHRFEVFNQGREIRLRQKA